MSAGSINYPGLWPEPFTLWPSISRLLLPFSTISAARRAQSRRRRGSVAVAPATTIYFSKLGNNANDGRTIGAPVLTIAKATSLASSNGAITRIVSIDAAPATYHETLTMPRNGLEFSAPPNVTIDGDATRAGVSIGAKTDWTLSGGFRITNTESSTYAIVGNACHRGLVDDVLIDTCPRGLFIASANNIVLRNMVVQDVSFRIGIYLRGCPGSITEDIECMRCKDKLHYLHGCPNSIVRRCYSHDSIVGDPGYGFECEEYAGTGSDDCSYFDIWAGDTGGVPLKYGCITKTSTNVRHQRCVAWNCGDVASGVGSAFYWKGSDGCMLYHSDLFDSIEGLHSGQDDISLRESSGTMKNCIVTNNTRGVVTANASTADTDYNLYDGNTNVAKLGGTTYATLAAYQGVGQEAHGLTGNPLYVSTVYGGYALGPGSPALGSGGDIGEGSGQNLGHTGSTYGA